MKILVKNSSQFEIFTNPKLKRDLLSFDEIAYEEDLFLHMTTSKTDGYPSLERNVQEMTYLLEKGLIQLITPKTIQIVNKTKNCLQEVEQLMNRVKDLSIELNNLHVKIKNAKNYEERAQWAMELSSLDIEYGSYRARASALMLSEMTGENYTSIYKHKHSNHQLTRKEDVLKFLFSQIPMPDENLPWEAIIDYKSDTEVRRRYYALIDWANEVANSNMSISQIEDKYNHLLNEYTYQLNLHKLKTQRTSFEILVTTAAEIIENVAWLKFGEVAKTLFNISKAKLDLLEAETQLKGRELAYIFDVNQKFGKK
jgi:hypothetical protein